MDQEPKLGVSDVLGAATDNPPEPRQSGENLTALGQTWKVSPVEQGIKGQQEQWVRAQAEAVIAEDVNPESRDESRSAYMSDRGAGHYNWGGRYLRKSLSDGPGLIHFLFLLLRRCQPEIAEEEAAEIFKSDRTQALVAINWALKNEKGPVKKKTGRTVAMDDQD